MAATAYELIDSRQVTYGENGRCDQHWQVEGAADEIEAYATLIAAIDTSYDVYDDGSMIWYRQSTEVETSDSNLWNYTVTYGVVRGAGANEADYEFDTTAQSQHITFGRKNVGSGVAPGTGAIVDYKLGINVTEDGPQGVDILMPSFSFSETHVFAAADVDFTFKRNLFQMTGCVNKAVTGEPTWRGFEAGEVLFAGATGRKNTDSGIWTINYKFLASPNRVNVPFNGSEVIPAVKGWDYLWIRMEPVKVGATDKIILRPFQWNIVEVYEYKDFGLLGLGY